jgi:phytoene dehydrogenase-like protein
MDEKYDVVVIGAGIGGLVCGCYLAKAGLKVLIAEQHYQPGGYCTSFKRNGYIFDVGVHYLGSMREDGILYKILKELEILDKMTIITNDPTDRIITPDKTIFIRKDKFKTREELILHFPNEKENINNFFNFILNPDFLYIVSKIKKLTFAELLDNSFSDYKLKGILSIGPFVSLGLPPSKISALASVVLYKEYILDGGYYPEGGIQVFPNLLAQRIKEFGGAVLFSTKVEKILVKNKKLTGVRLANGETLSTKFVVSNADATATFEELLDSRSLEAKLVKKLKPSVSAFIIYLGINKKIDISPKHYTTCLFSTYDIEKCYRETNNLIKLSGFSYMLCTFASLIDPTLVKIDKSVLRIFMGANYADRKLWERKKETICENAMKMLETLVPGINNHVEIKEIGIPPTFVKFTSNRNGALFGWSVVPSQINKNVFPSETSVENLYLAGHWATNGAGQGGVSPSALSGRIAARLIIRKHNTKIL